MPTSSCLGLALSSHVLTLLLALVLPCTFLVQCLALLGVFSLLLGLALSLKVYALTTSLVITQFLTLYYLLVLQAVIKHIGLVQKALNN